ncbi:MAG TPA: hypothetical protein DCO75_09705, partial [Fibrobacteres bacterium]|nr:hypothetical protein [Fibrobacterota bacterium]
MKNKSLFTLLFFCIASANSATVDLTGKVLNDQNVAVSFVVVTLKGTNIIDTTQSDGIYHLVGSIAAIKNSAAKKSVIQSTDFHNGKLRFGLTNSGSFAFELYNLKGSRIAVFHKVLSAGNYSINPFGFASGVSGIGTYIIKVNINGQSQSLKSSWLGGKASNTLRQIDDFSTISKLHTSSVDSVSNIDTVLIAKGGMEITSITTTSLIDTLPDCFIVQRNIGGNFSVTPQNTPGKILARLTGDDIDGEHNVKLGYNSANNSYSGFLYMTYSPDVKNYNVFVDVYSTDSLLVGRSVNVPFQTPAIGDIDVPSFDPNNH